MKLYNFLGCISDLYYSTTMSKLLIYSVINKDHNFLYAQSLSQLPVIVDNISISILCEILCFPINNIGIIALSQGRQR